MKTPKLSKDELVDAIIAISTSESNPPNPLQLKKLKKELKKLPKPALVGRHLEVQRNSTTTPNVPPKIVWSVDMVDCLLRLRLKDFGDQFAGSKSNQQRAIIWNRLTEKFKLSINKKNPLIVYNSKKNTSL